MKPFGTRSGFTVKDVSIGGMRLPQDSAVAVELVRHAIDSGMTYIDTSRGYGESEFVIGRALKDGYREKVVLSTKCSPWIKKVDDSDDGSADSVRRRIDESMLRLDVEYLDFYQVWNVNSKDAWELANKKGGMVEGIRRARDEGLVKHIGFTTHEKPDALLGYLDQADWCEIILMTYNLLNREYEAPLQKAHELGIGTIVMNPVGGGRLTEESPVLSSLCEQVGAADLADLAVRFVLSNPNVDTILCGMTKKSDVDATFSSANARRFSEAEMEAINAFVANLSRENVQFCTSCQYCMPCPTGIQIPRIMSAIYNERFLGLSKSAEQMFKGATREIAASACIECGKCEEKCTQSLPIIKELKWAVARWETE